MAIFFAIAAVSAAAWHSVVASYVTAVFGASVTAVAAFQLLNYLQLGYLDPFFLIAIVTSSFLAAGIALLVGLPFRARRRAAAANEKAQPRGNQTD